MKKIRLPQVAETPIKNPIYPTLWMALFINTGNEGPGKWAEQPQVCLGDIPWDTAESIAKAQHKPTRLSTSEGYNNMGYYYKPELNDKELAQAEARFVSLNEGCTVHVNYIARTDSYEVSDWYSSDGTVESYTNGEKH